MRLKDNRMHPHRYTCTLFSLFAYSPFNYSHDSSAVPRMTAIMPASR